MRQKHMTKLSLREKQTEKIKNKLRLEDENYVRSGIRRGK